MDLSEIISQVSVPQRDCKNWFWGLWIKLFRNQGPRRGTKNVGWLVDNYSRTKHGIKFCDIYGNLALTGFLMSFILEFKSLSVLFVLTCQFFICFFYAQIFQKQNLIYIENLFVKN